MTKKTATPKKRKVDLELSSFSVRLGSSGYSTKKIEVRFTPKGTPFIFQEGNDLLTAKRLEDFQFLTRLAKALFHTFNLEIVPYIQQLGGLFDE